MECPFKTVDGWDVKHSPVLGGSQFVFKFPNGWGASVVRHRVSYGNESGLWELAVLDNKGDINYRHPVSERDVRGFLSEDDASRLLAEIAATTSDTKMLGEEDTRSSEEIVELGIRAIESMAKLGDVSTGGA